MGKNLLTVKDLTVNVEEKEILHGVDLSVGAGEGHVLMGPNGAASILRLEKGRRMCCLDRMVPESRRLAIRCSAIRNIT